MKKQINYPIKVLKRRMSKEDYEPFALDCNTGEYLEVKRGKGECLAFLLLQLLFIVASLAIVYFTIAQPLIQTTQARSTVETTLANLGGEDTETVKLLKNSGTLVSESLDGNLINLVINVDVGELQDALKLAFSISTVKEVYTDGKTLTVTFLSSGK